MQTSADQSVAAITGLINAGREAEAVAGIRGLVAQKPPLADGWQRVLALCDQLGDEDTSVEIARLLGEADIENIACQIDYTRRLSRVGRMDDALAFMQAVTDHYRDDADAACQYGTLLSQAGRFDAAEPQLRRAITLRPGFGDAWVQLGAFLDFSTCPDDVAAMQAAAQDGAAQASPALDYALGKAFDDLGDTAAAMAAWDRANRRMRSVRPFDRKLLDYMASLPARFGSIQPALEGEAGAGPRAIFIIGAPRTGTSLVEQILSAHPDVHGLGESLISRIATWPARHLSPFDLANVEAAGPAAWRQMGQIYTALAGNRAGASPVVTDKAAALHLFTGVLARALPNAKFIWVSRAPEAAALSAYRAYFGGNHAWSTRLEDAFDFLHGHDQLSAHWQSVLGERMLKLSYQDLVTRPDTEITRLAAFCGLSADPALLRFHDNPRPVLTASLGQIRRPVTTASVEGWHRYGGVIEAAKVRATTTRGV